MSLATDDSSTLPGLCRVRHDWTRAEIGALFDLPFPELIFRAQSIHRQYFDPAEVQISTLLSIKTGGCPEDCAYCPQSARYDTGIHAEKLMALDTVVAEARAASAWARPGVRPRTATLRGCVRWSRRSKDWDWRPAPRSACSVRRRRGSSSVPDSIITTTTSTPRRNFTVKSSQRGSTGIGWKRSHMCVTPASMSAAAASSAWARPAAIASA